MKRCEPRINLCLVHVGGRNLDIHATNPLTKNNHTATLTLRLPPKFRHYHLITPSSSINQLHLDIIAHCFNVCSTVLYDLPYLLVGLLSVFDINSPSNTPLKKRLHHGHGAGASPMPLHCRSHLVAPPASTTMLDCPAPGHATTG
jgi:hypothetical protein